MRSWEDESLLRRPPQEDSAAIERGMPKAQAARLFDVSLSSVKRYSRTARQGGSLEPRKSPGRPHKIDEKAQLLLEKDVEERPAATVTQRRHFLEHVSGRSEERRVGKECRSRWSPY